MYNFWEIYSSSFKTRTPKIFFYTKGTIRPGRAGQLTSIMLQATGLRPLWREKNHLCRSQKLSERESSAGVLVFQQSYLVLPKPHLEFTDVSDLHLYVGEAEYGLWKVVTQGSLWVRHHSVSVQTSSHSLLTSTVRVQLPLFSPFLRQGTWGSSQDPSPQGQAQLVTGGTGSTIRGLQLDSGPAMLECSFVTVPADPREKRCLITLTLKTEGET